MPTPYRKATYRAKPAAETRSGARWDDWVLAGLLVAVAAPRVVLALANHERFGAEPSLAVISLALGVLLLISTALRGR